MSMADVTFDEKGDRLCITPDPYAFSPYNFGGVLNLGELLDTSRLKLLDIMYLLLPWGGLTRCQTTDEVLLSRCYLIRRIVDGNNGGCLR